MFDSHCHLEEDALEVLLRAEQAGVKGVVVIALSHRDLDRYFSLTQPPIPIYLAAGVHPCSVESIEPGYFERVSSLAKEGKLVAIGETGLDYYRGESSASLQKEWLARHIDLANRFDLPLLIHCRSAYPALFDSLPCAPSSGALLHCYSDSLSVALHAVEKGFYFGFGGVITFKKSESLQQVFSSLPLDRILLETDAPFLSPEPVRGKKNEPAFLPFVLKKAAEIRQVPIEFLEAALDRNRDRFFRLSPSQDLKTN